MQRKDGEGVPSKDKWKTGFRFLKKEAAPEVVVKLTNRCQPWLAWWKISMRFTNYTKYRRFQMQTCCVYMLKTLRFYEWFSLKSDAELLLMFLNIKTKKQRFCVHPKAEACDFIFSTFELQTRLLPNAVILLVESVHLDQKNLKKSSLIRFAVVNLCFSESKITFLHTK